MSSQDSVRDEPLRPWERRGLVLLLVVIVVFGGLVLYRSAFLSRRMGDLGVYLRTAWAVRSGADLYSVTDNNGWHYCYPPLSAILCTPLADPPPGVAWDGAALPYPASVLVWYVLNLACLAFAVHALASALETAVFRDRPPVRFGRRWWWFRLTPVLFCLIPIGHTLMRGQVNLFVLALLCCGLAAMIRGRRLLGGLCLAGMICIKIYPAFLLLHPLARRDGRCLFGCALGLLVGLVLIPVAALGPTRTWEAYGRLGERVLGPGLGLGGDQTLARELTNTNATGSQSFIAVFHNALHLDRDNRPEQASASVRLPAMALGGLLALLPLWAARRRTPKDAVGETLLLGALTLNMLFLCPVCHLHYFCLGLPLVMALLVRCVREGTTLRAERLIACLLVVFLGLNVLPHLPRFWVTRDLGLSAATWLVIWAAGVWVLAHPLARAAKAGPAWQDPARAA
jgi:hypothetical protein